MEKYYRFAGAEICIRIPQDRIYQAERQLAPFAVDDVRDPWVFEFSPAEEFPAPKGQCVYSASDLAVWEEENLHQLYRGNIRRGWENTTLYTASRGRHHVVHWKNSDRPGPIGVKTVLESLNAAHLVNQAGGCILHCSYIAHQGKAILFTAPSGTGKSTQAELWKTHRGADIINGDRAAVRMVEGVPMAQAIPFAGSSPYCLNRDLPLAAVVYLGQAETPSVQPLRGAQAFRSVWEGCTVNLWDAGDIALATQAITQLVQAIPVLRLDCPPDRSAVQALESYLSGR